MARSKKRFQGEGWTVVRSCPDCGRPETECGCGSNESSGPMIVRIRLERRRGKAVTVLDTQGVPLETLKTLAKTLKARVGSGGTVKGSAAEIQGDHREVARELFGAEGIDVRG